MKFNELFKTPYIKKSDLFDIEDSICYILDKTNKRIGYPKKFKDNDREKLILSEYYRLRGHSIIKEAKNYRFKLIEEYNELRDIDTIKLFKGICRDLEFYKREIKQGELPASYFFEFNPNDLNLNHFFNYLMKFKDSNELKITIFKNLLLDFLNSKLNKFI